MAARTYSKASVERALEIHAARRLIQAWRVNEDHRYVITLSNGLYLELRTLREAWIFANGLGSAAQATRENA
jgi:hypothetical protein